MNTEDRRKQRLLLQAKELVKELDKGDWPEDLEPHEVAWILSELLKLLGEAL